MSHCFEKRKCVDWWSNRSRTCSKTGTSKYPWLIIDKTRVKFFFNLLWSDSNCLHPNNKQRYRFETFACKTKEKYLPVVWNESVHPTRTNHFLVHILLNMGSFVNEYSLFSQPNIRESYFYGRLLDPLAPHHSAKLLTRRYFEKQLSRLPARTFTFNKYLVAAYQCFQELSVS
jgi:hypothetical protein